MKFHELWCILLITVFSNIFPGSNGDVDPLVLVYYPEEQEYIISNLQTVQNNAANSPPYSKVVFLCPRSSASIHKRSVLFEIKEIESGNSSKLTKGYYGCRLDPQVLLIPSIRDVHQSATYTVAYEIQNDQRTRELLQLNGLGDTEFPYKQNVQNKIINDDPSERYILYLTIDKEKLALSNTYHRIDVRHDDQKTPIDCEDHRYVGEFDKGNISSADILKYYDHENQEDLMGEFFWPSLETFVPHQLAPVEDFIDYYSRLASCTVLNTLPIWRIVAEESMHRVEQYIRNVAAELPVNTLSVYSFTSGQLKLQSKEDPNTNEILSKPVYLDPNGRIPIPEAVVKVVSYRTPSSISPTNIRKYHSLDDDEYRIAIVIHNEIEVPVQRTCRNSPEDLCDKMGWKFNGSMEDRRVYCCLQNLDVSSVDVNTQESAGHKPFDLNSVPVGFERNINVVEELRKMGKIPN